MGQAWNARDEFEDFSEPAVNMPVYVAGVANVVATDGLLNIAYYVDMPGPHSTERAICLRVIMPVAALHRARAKVDMAVTKTKRLPDC
jgi:hypothetical protein